MSEPLFPDPDDETWRPSGAAIAVLALIRERGDGIENSWDKREERYTAEPVVHLWKNYRERGYVISLRRGPHQINIAFFEHRSSDSIDVLEFLGDIDGDVEFNKGIDEEVLEKAWDDMFQFDWGAHGHCATYILERLEEWWSDPHDWVVDEGSMGLTDTCSVCGEGRA